MIVFIGYVCTGIVAFALITGCSSELHDRRGRRKQRSKEALELWHERYDAAFLEEGDPVAAVAAADAAPKRRPTQLEEATVQLVEVRDAFGQLQRLRERDHEMMLSLARRPAYPRAGPIQVMVPSEHVTVASFGGAPMPPVPVDYQEVTLTERELVECAKCKRAALEMQRGLRRGFLQAHGGPTAANPAVPIIMLPREMQQGARRDFERRWEEEHGPGSARFFENGSQ